MHASVTTPIRLRWVAIGVLLFSGTLNYLDRQLLAAASETIKIEFHLNSEQYGEILAVFSIAYALSAPFAGLLIDRVGLNIGLSLAVGLWSLAGAATGWAQSFGALLGVRTVLAAAEAGGQPAIGKANGVYLLASEFALGTAVNQVGLSIGGVAAPLVIGFMEPRYGWRSGFVLCGVLGLLWIPVWWWTARKIPGRTRESMPQRESTWELLRDRRVWGFIVAPLFIMGLYTLWTNWTTQYFVHEWHLPQDVANRTYAWIPPVFAGLGGFGGGWTAFFLIRRGMRPVAARLRVCSIAATLMLLTAAIPLAPSVQVAAAAVSLSFFVLVFISGNLYSLPIDLLGPGRAAFGVAVLTFSYGIMQALLSPKIGKIVDQVGFPTVCYALAATPLIGVAILHFTARERIKPST
jgi:ACS family hexuronate transporter-like MFS transporter